jgi:hypothetical protein
MTLTRWCAACAADSTFDRLDCLEHPEECVELCCVLCGAGFELGPVQAEGVLGGLAGLGETTLGRVTRQL